MGDVLHELRNLQEDLEREVSQLRATLTPIMQERLQKQVVELSKPPLRRQQASERKSRSEKTQSSVNRRAVDRCESSTLVPSVSFADTETKNDGSDLDFDLFLC